MDFMDHIVVVGSITFRNTAPHDNNALTVHWTSLNCCASTIDSSSKTDQSFVITSFVHPCPGCLCPCKEKLRVGVIILPKWICFCFGRWLGLGSDWDFQTIYQCTTRNNCVCMFLIFQPLSFILKWSWFNENLCHRMQWTRAQMKQFFGSLVFDHWYQCYKKESLVSGAAFPIKIYVKPW